mmetsp:Transcript_19652/g.42770  ORF Transcript_19652/g.42770 Transcript_19652/m.42770 type:complete len:513 (-) Transcript_19652:98-1636(-)
MPESARAYEAVKQDEGKGVKPPKPSRVLGCLTSGWMRLFVLTWAAYMLTVLAVTWYGITAYHLAGPKIKHDEGTWGAIYDVTRDVSQSGITVAGVASDVIAGKEARLRLKDDEFEIVTDDFKTPKGWQSVLIHSWMVIATVLNCLLALITWFVVIKNSLITCCGIERFDASQETREHRQELAADVALAWQLVIPFMTWLIEHVTGYKNCGIAPHLFRRVMAIGPLVLIGQKILVLLMRSLKDAIKALNNAGDISWTICSKDLATKTRETKRCALDIFEKSHILNMGPWWLQKACGVGIIAGVFEGRPYGLILGIFGFVDKVIITRVTLEVLGAIPSWIADDIDKVEAKLDNIGADADKLKAELTEHLLKIRRVFESAKRVLDQAEDDLKHARATVAKHILLIGQPVALRMEKTIDEVSRPLAVIADDTDKACASITAVELEIEKEANKTVTKIHEMIKTLTGYLECLRPLNVLRRLDDLADDALYGEVIQLMAESKKAGAPALEYQANGKHF